MIFVDLGAVLGAKMEPKSIKKSMLNKLWKMMMTRMAKKLHIGGYECARNHDPEPRGGGGRRAKPLLQYSTKDWMEYWATRDNNLLWVSTVVAGAGACA